VTDPVEDLEAAAGQGLMGLLAVATGMIGSRAPQTISRGRVSAR
jgi:hypothetical protein